VLLFYVQKYRTKTNYEQTKLGKFLKEKQVPNKRSIIYPVTNKHMFYVNILPIIHGEAVPEKYIDVYQRISL
jgi:hypothetical protein